MKMFKGIRHPQEGPLVFVFEGEKTLGSVLPTHQAYRNEANGFEWGFNGAAARQLALAMFITVFGREDESVWHYAEFAKDVIARLDGATFEMTEAKIREWVARLVSESTR